MNSDRAGFRRRTRDEQRPTVRTNLGPVFVIITLLLVNSVIL